MKLWKIDWGQQLSDNLPYSYNEKRTSGSENWDMVNGSRSLTRIFEGPWTDRYNFIEDYLGLTIVQGNTTFGTSHPVDENAKPLRLTVAGMGATDINTNTLLIEHDRAIITVEYGQLPHNGGIVGNRELNYPDYLYVTESFSSEVELLELQNKNVTVKWASSELVVDASASKKYQFPLHLLNYSIHIPVNTFVLTPEDYNVYDPYDEDENSDGTLYYDIVYLAAKYGGTVNNIDVRSFSGLVFPIKTLRFDNFTAETNQNFHLEDRGVYTVTLNFVYNPIGWDQSFEANDAGVIALTTIDPPPYTGTLAFESRFPGLFTAYE